MPRYAYDLHIHSCLSPCGDELMTPPNIVNMAAIKGLDIIAVTDHNSAKNVRAVMKAAENLPLTVIPGMEITTAEEIHVIALFPDADSAEKAGEELERHLPKVKNRPEFFGEQLIMDENEAITGEFPYLLSNATDLSVDVIQQFVTRFGGICFPAHIDRSSNSMISVFGYIPEKPFFNVLEVHNPERFFKEETNRQLLDDRIIITSSDAHQLSDISERDHFLKLEDITFRSVAKAVFTDLAENT